MTTKPMWRIAAGRGGFLAKSFTTGNLVAVGFREAGDCTNIASREAMLDHFRAVYATKTEQQILILASQLWRFLNVCAIGDDIISYDPGERLYQIGHLTSKGWFDSSGEEEVLTRRSVEWRGVVARDTLSEEVKSRLIVGITVSLVAPEVAAVVLSRIGERLPTAALPSPSLPAVNDVSFTEERSDPFAGLEGVALERLKDRIGALDGYAMQDLTAALLRAMGYRTTVSARGADRGRDIIASPDGYGLVPPRIVVEVKHRAGHIGAPDVRSFLGGRHREDRGLYVSTGGFTNEARYEAERAAIPVKLMTLDDFARAISDHYDRFDEAGRTLLPLTRILWAN